jgi:hypothetical protein
MAIENKNGELGMEGDKVGQIHGCTAINQDDRMKTCVVVNVQFVCMQEVLIAADGNELVADIIRAEESLEGEYE